MSDEIETEVEVVEFGQDLGPAVVRTVVPLVVSLVAGLLARAGLEVDDSLRQSIVSLVSLLVGAGYYVIVRELERRWAGAGWLLGSPRAPYYEPRRTMPVDEPVIEGEA
jgi:hypothetical protein